MVLPFTIVVLLTSSFFCGEISQNYEKKRGLAEGLCNFRIVFFFLSNLNDRANHKVTLMMDGFDLLPPKNGGHDSLVAILLIERKTCCHLAQAP